MSNFITLALRAHYHLISCSVWYLKIVISWISRTLHRKIYFESDRRKYQTEQSKTTCYLCWFAYDVHVHLLISTLSSQYQYSSPKGPSFPQALEIAYLKIVRRCQLPPPPSLPYSGLGSRILQPSRVCNVAISFYHQMASGTSTTVTTASIFNIYRGIQRHVKRRLTSVGNPCYIDSRYINICKVCKNNLTVWLKILLRRYIYCIMWYLPRPLALSSLMDSIYTVGSWILSILST